MSVGWLVGWLVCWLVRNARTNLTINHEWILMILIYNIDIDKTLKLTQGQGHKVKGQGHIGIYVEK